MGNMTEEDYKENIKQERLKLGIDRLEDLVEKEDNEMTDSTVAKMETAELKPDKSGYMNEEQYLKKHGSLEGFKSKDKFDADGSFFKKIEAQNKKIEELIEFNKQAMEANQIAKKAGYEQALRDIQTKKLDAIREGDVDEVLALEQKAAHIAEEVRQHETTIKPKIVEDSEVVKDFKAKHASWLNSNKQEDTVIQAAAAAELHIIMKSSPNMSEEDAIVQIENELARRFPNRFKNENKSLPPLNTQSTVGREEIKKTLSTRLNKQQKDFIKNARRFGSTLTEEEYAKQLELAGKLDD